MSNNSTPKNIKFLTGITVYNVSPSDDIINIDTTASPVLIVLPNIQNAQLNLYRKNFYINDITNTAFTNNITIIAAGGIVNSGQVTKIKINNGSAICTIVDTNEYQVGTDNPTSGGGSSTYGGASPTTVVVEDFPIGTNILGLTYDDLFQNIYAPYVSPSFTSFSISGFPTSYEVGDTIGGPQTFVWSFSNISNVSPNTMDILDITGGTALATNISNVSPAAGITIATYTPVVPSSYSWRGQATNTQLGVFLSSFFTASWFWRKYYGESALTSLTESQIESLTNNPLSNTLVGSYSFAALDYKYFCWPDSFGSPSPSTGSTGFLLSGSPCSMVSVTFDPTYNLVQNGYYYYLLPVTNSFGITTNYRVYRTLNTLGAAVVITVN